MTIEREVKLGVWPGFSLPELTDVAEGITIEHVPPTHLEATYFDTGDLRLARWGISLRHRAGDDGGDTWTLKLPASSEGIGLTRDEIDVPGERSSMPASLRSLVTAHVRGAELVPAAVLHTDRQRTLLRGPDGKLVAEIVDDEVSVLDGRHVALRFREVEVEAGPAADDAVLEEVVVRLRGAGAGVPDPTPKVVRALGPRALSVPDVVLTPLPTRPSAADVLQHGITKAVLRILGNDAGVRIGEDPEAVHQARVGTRRLRSDLRTFGRLVDRSWSEPLRTELAWLAGLLGDVRDLDVLRARLTSEIDDLHPDDARHAAPLLAVIDARLAAARAALLESMSTSRYVALLDRLVDAARDPHVLPAASAPARDVLPSLVARPWSALRAAVKRAGMRPADEELHAIRIRAKRARYAADVAAPVVGARAARFATALAELQDRLGEHHDACVRESWLRGVAASLPSSSAALSGQLLAGARAAAASERRAWPEAWARVDRGKVRSWLSR